MSERLRLLARRAVLVVSAALILVACTQVLLIGYGETPVHGGPATVPTIDGGTDTTPLLVPLALFVIGGSCFFLALGWDRTRP